VEGIHAFFSLRALEQWDLTVKPCPRPTYRPFIFNHDSHLQSTAFVPLGVKIKAPKLRLQNGSVNFHFLQLIVQLISLWEAIGGGSTSEAGHYPKIL
jgi:hypothetical protein